MECSLYMTAVCRARVREAAGTELYDELLQSCTEIPAILKQMKML